MANIKHIHQFERLFKQDVEERRDRIIENIRESQEQQPTPQVKTDDYRPKSKVVLTRFEADEIIELVEQARAHTETLDSYTQEHKDIWDQYWKGIGQALKAYRNPRVTLKMLMWCYRSITKSMGAEYCPQWMDQMIKDLRREEKRNAQ